MADWQPVMVTRDGVWRCAECRDELPETWEGPRHLGLRFESDPSVAIPTRAWISEIRRGKWHVSLNREVVTQDTIELVIGDEGWVARYARNRDGDRFLCSNPRNLDEHPMYTIERGRVDVVPKLA